MSKSILPSSANSTYHFGVLLTYAVEEWDYVGEVKRES